MGFGVGFLRRRVVGPGGTGQGCLGLDTSLADRNCAEKNGFKNSHGGAVADTAFH